MHLRKLLSILLSIFIAVLPLLAEEQPSYIDHNRTLYRVISNESTKEFDAETYGWGSHSYMEFLEKAIDSLENMKPWDQRELAFNLLNQREKRVKELPEKYLDKATWSDLDLLYGKSNKSVYLGKMIDRTSTEIGFVTLASKLLMPASDIKELKQRQNVIRELVDNKETFSYIDNALKDIEPIQNILLNFWDRNELFSYEISNSLFKGKLTKGLNKSALALDIKRIGSHFRSAGMIANMFIACVLVPTYLVTKSMDINFGKDFLKNKFDGFKSTAIPFGGFLAEHIEKAPAGATMLGLTTALKWSEDAPHIIDYSRGRLMLDKYLQSRLIRISKFIYSSKDILDAARSSEHLKNTDSFKKLEKFWSDETSENLDRFLKVLNSNTFKGEASYISRFGRVLQAYSLIGELRNEIEDMMSAIGEIDAYVSMVRLYKEFEDKRVKYCFVDFIENSKRPYINMIDYWHPMIDTNKVVSNSITLGGKERPNAIITGPNAGGKSTAMKSIVSNLILAQTFGVAAATHLNMTPFENISTYIEIGDDLGAGNSRFQSEVLRAQKIIETSQESLDKGDFSFLIMDEMFNGTSPKEGEACAYSVAEELGKYPNTICVLASHFDMLKKLEKTTDSFKNYKVKVYVSGDSKVSYPYTLEPGESDQNVAINILQSQGFSTSVIGRAQEIVASESN